MNYHSKKHRYELSFILATVMNLGSK